MIKTVIAFLSGIYVAQEYNIPRVSVKAKEIYENVISKYKKEE
jgi:hypothetical protein